MGGTRVTKVFPAQRLLTWERRYDVERKRIIETDKKSYLWVDSDADAYIDEAIAHRWLSAITLTSITKDPASWAAVFFTTVISNSDEVIQARAELAEAIRFGGYGATQPGMNYPPFGVAVINSRAALEAASSRHEVFQKMWDALQGCEPDKNWVAIVHP
jgi:hypothetical protein